MEGDFQKATNITALPHDDLDNNIGNAYSTIINIKTVSTSGKKRFIELTENGVYNIKITVVDTAHNKAVYNIWLGAHFANQTPPIL